MYAVFQVGKNQYQVNEGDLVRLEKLPADVGQKVVFEQVLLTNNETDKPQIGRPFLKNLCVEAEVVKHYRGQKILVYRFTRRKGFHKQQGHKQHYTSVRVTRIGEARA